MPSRPALAALAVAALTLTACNVDIDLGETISRDFAVDDFDSVTIDAPFDVTIRTGDRQHVEIEASEGIFDDLEVEVTDGNLLIDIDRSAFRIGGGDLVASITVTDLTAVTASGAADVVVPNVDLGTLDLAIGGASSISLSGVVETLDLQLSGASDADLIGTEIAVATVDLSGASDADFGEGVELIEGDLSGASNLEVDASTNVRVETSGASSVDRN